MSDQAAQPLNYSAFAGKIRLSRKWLNVLIAGVALIVAGIAASVISQSAWGGFMVVLGIFLLGLGGAVCAWEYSKSRQAQIQQFILDNGWQPYDYDNTDYVATSLIGIGYNQRIVSGFSGQYRGFEIHGVHYQYVTGSGKSQQTHNFVDLHFTVSETLPLILLDSKHNRALGVFNDLPERIPGGKTLQLEGDFGDDFVTTVLPGTEQEVLQFLTPDFMQALISGPDKTDVEMEGNNVFVIFHSSDFNLNSLREMFAAADIVLEHVSKTAGVWQASSSAETVQNMQTTALAPRDKILFRSRHVTIGSIIGIALYVIIQIIQVVLRHR